MGSNFAWWFVNMFYMKPQNSFFKILSYAGPRGIYMEAPLETSENLENTFTSIIFVSVEISKWNFGHTSWSPIPIIWLKKFPPWTPLEGTTTNFNFQKRDFQVLISWLLKHEKLLLQDSTKGSACLEAWNILLTWKNHCLEQIEPPIWKPTASWLYEACRTIPTNSYP